MWNRENLVSSRENNKLNRSSVNRKISDRIVKMSAPAMSVRTKQEEEQEKSHKDRVRMQNELNNNIKTPVDRLPLVTTLLRACRDGNEMLIKTAMRDVIMNAATKDELNLTDKSGRVSQRAMEVSFYRF